ncbi:MAG: hypothetical protein RIS11_1697 [Pseudomonadota bacterium]|jgi:hypothetical protein
MSDNASAAEQIIDEWVCIEGAQFWGSKESLPVAQQAELDPPANAIVHRIYEEICNCSLEPAPNIVARF